MVVMNKKMPDPTRKLRVGCFYRVSSKGQLEDDDIPMQRRVCTSFLEDKGWIFVKEYVEKAVSGLWVPAEKRGDLQEAMRDAEEGVIDVILCFMFDRLGRREHETPYIVQWFARHVEVWSATEGQQKFEQHSDKLMNYVRYWQAEGESLKTSIRVIADMTQMVEDGLFTGGSAGYGYKLVKTGLYNKKGKELFRRAKDEKTNHIAYQIYDFVYSYGYGSTRIAKYFNSPEINIPSPTGGKWTASTINSILKNPLYKGMPAIKKRKDEDGKLKTIPTEDQVLPKKPIPELITVPGPMWDAVQVIRSSRNQENTNNPDIEKVLVSKSPLLLVGMIYCGYCGSPMTTTYNSKKYQLADGTTQKWRQAKYRCSGKALGKADCAGQTIYSQTKIETVVLDELYAYLDHFKQVDVTDQLNKIKKKNTSQEDSEIKGLAKRLRELTKEIATLTAEVPKSILGKSAFKPELLNELIEQKQNEITSVESTLKKLEKTVLYKKVEKTEMENLVRSIPVWKESFQKSPVEKRKMMLNDVIDRVIVYRDQVDLKIKLKVQELSGISNGSETDSRGRAHRWQR
ncbi:serine recombinase [Paenibacillus antibioticophila]|uniref:Serine recombinase n=1 Tax=Paenibacillus antibioticophila TaxID=1274374 RepID=A0A919XQ96_9BACL|nr:serine recombinase [Paenibacillus antibioticophila]